jgi:hypothetical protein
MRLITGAVAWVYDFLAEDLILLIGALIAVGICVAAVHTVKHVAWVFLWIAVVLVITISLWRTAMANSR